MPDGGAWMKKVRRSLYVPTLAPRASPGGASLGRPCGDHRSAGERGSCSAWNSAQAWVSARGRRPSQVQLVESQVDAVIGHATLREIVGADALASIPLPTRLLRATPPGMALAPLAIEQPRASTAIACDGFGARPVILALDAMTSANA